MGCIYKITNIINNKIYIGLTKFSAEQRFNQHLNNKNSKANKNCYLHKSIRKYGELNFKVETLIEGNFNKTLLIELEKHYIQLYNSYVGTSKNGYNLTTGGEGGENKIVSVETKLKMSIAQKNKSYRPSKESIEKGKLSRSWYIPTEEHKRKIGLAHKGRIISKESREKISKTLQGHSFNKGISKSEEHKKKLSESTKLAFANGQRQGLSNWCYVYNENDDLLFKFKSVSEAERSLNITRSRLIHYPKLVFKRNKLRIIISKHEF